MTIKIYPLKTIRRNKSFGPAWEIECEKTGKVWCAHEYDDAVAFCEDVITARQLSERNESHERAA